jgi:hypothetical protein
MKQFSILRLLAGSALLCAVPVSLQLSQDTLSVSLDKANARVGRPLTPGSVAGVHRRVERRAVRRAYYGETAGTMGAAAASTSYYNGNWGYRNGPGYGVAAAGLAAGAAMASTAYGSFAGGMYRGWDGNTIDGYYPTRTIYAHSYVSPSYYGPVCNPGFDRLCQ